jgi:hypothetical protein
MIDEEMDRQHMEIAGEEVLVCDRCGRPFPRAELAPFEPASPLAEPIEEFWYCRACRLEIEHSEEVLQPEDEEH